MRRDMSSFANRGDDTRELGPDPETTYALPTASKQLAAPYRRAPFA
jgi:hypothetical protein